MKLTVGLLGVGMAALHAAALAADAGATATVTLAAGPHAGKYHLSSDDACLIAAFVKAKPAGFSVLLLADNASLSIDIPNVERTNELQIEFVVANANNSTSRKGTATTKYVVDARPDAALESHQREERGPRSAGGAATVKLTQQTASATLEFSAQTSTAVKLEGAVECRTVNREYAR